MSEYTNVERPFLDKLRQFGGEVIDHGTGFIPQNPAVSRRTSLREIILEQVFRAALKRINLTGDGRSWMMPFPASSSPRQNDYFVAALDIACGEAKDMVVRGSGAL